MTLAEVRRAICNLKIHGHLVPANRIYRGQETGLMTAGALIERTAVLKCLDRLDFREDFLGQHRRNDGRE